MGNKASKNNNNNHHLRVSKRSPPSPFRPRFSSKWTKNVLSDCTKSNKNGKISEMDFVDFLIHYDSIEEAGIICTRRPWLLGTHSHDGRGTAYSSPSSAVFGDIAVGGSSSPEDRYEEDIVSSSPLDEHPRLTGSNTQRHNNASSESTILLHHDDSWNRVEGFWQPVRMFGILLLCGLVIFLYLLKVALRRKGMEHYYYDETIYSTTSSDNEEYSFTMNLQDSQGAAHCVSDSTSDSFIVEEEEEEERHHYGDENIQRTVHLWSYSSFSSTTSSSSSSSLSSLPINGTGDASLSVPLIQTPDLSSHHCGESV